MVTKNSAYGSKDERPEAAKKNPAYEDTRATRPLCCCKYIIIKLLDFFFLN